MIKVIFFDLDDTLYSSEPIYEQGLKNAWEIFKLSAVSKKKLDWNEFSKSYLEARNAIKIRLHDSASVRSRLLYFKELVQNECDRFSLELVLKMNDAYSEAFQDINYDSVQPVLVELKKKFSIGIITNQLTMTQLQKLKNLDADGSILNWIITSEEAGCEKPDSKIFKLALERAQVSPNEAMMVGDDWKCDVEGALNVGITPVYFNKNKTSLDSRVRVISNLNELL